MTIWDHKQSFCYQNLNLPTGFDSLIKQTCWIRNRRGIPYYVGGRNTLAKISFCWFFLLQHCVINLCKDPLLFLMGWEINEKKRRGLIHVRLWLLSTYQKYISWILKSNNFITLNYYIIIRKKQRCRVPEKSRSSLLWVNFLAWF